MFVSGFSLIQVFLPSKFQANFQLNSLFANTHHISTYFLEFKFIILQFVQICFFKFRVTSKFCVDSVILSKHRGIYSFDTLFVFNLIILDYKVQFWLWLSVFAYSFRAKAKFIDMCLNRSGCALNLFLIFVAYLRSKAALCKVVRLYNLIINSLVNLSF